MESHLRAVVPALVLSLFGGLLATGRQFGPLAASDFGASISTIGPLITLLAVLSLVVVPLLAAVAGYLDGRQTALVGSHWSLVGLLLLVGLFGHLVGFGVGLAVFAALVGVSATSGFVSLAVSALVSTLAGTVSITTACVAGAGIGYLSRADVAGALGA
jgi:hypothetical protein